MHKIIKLSKNITKSLKILKRFKDFTLTQLHTSIFNIFIYSLKHYITDVYCINDIITVFAYHARTDQMEF